MNEYDALLLNVGQALKAAREGAGITQVQLARAVGTSQNAISQYENGKHAMSLWMLRNLCAALKVSADEVLGLEVGDGR